jgi:hypothetical protein
LVEPAIYIRQSTKFRGGQNLCFFASLWLNNFVETVTKLTNELVASYARLGGINHLDGKNLPSKRAITDITCDLLRLLFPGYFDEKLIHSSEMKSARVLNIIRRKICRKKKSRRRRMI